MTDIMKLADTYADRFYLDRRYHNEESSYDRAASRAALQSAIEALQGECAEHKENAIRNARQAVAFRAERDALQAKLDAAHEVLDSDDSKIVRNAADGYPEGREPRELALSERVEALCTYAKDWKRWCEEVQTKLDELQRQEPVAWHTEDHLTDRSATTYDKGVALRWEGKGWPVTPLYAAPKALEPLTDCRIELVTAIHTLASHYENRLHRLDADDRKLAEGDIAHAIKIASKWNWNGITKGTPT